MCCSSRGSTRDAGFLRASDRTQTESGVSISRCLTQTSTKNCFKEVHVSGYLNESSLLDLKMLHILNILSLVFALKVIVCVP